MKPVFIGGGLIALALVGFIGYSLVVGNNKEVLENTQQENTLTEVAEQPTVTEEEPVEVLNKEDIVIRVENGAGVAGIAGRTQTFLEEAGFTVASIGNSDISGKTTTTLKFKDDKIKYQDLLVEAMSEDFTTDVESNLDETLDYDVLITVGSDAQI